MEESFTLDELDQSDILQAIEVPFVENNTICTCRGICLRENGRNACPCKNIGQFCTSACHVNGDGSYATCLNRRRVLEGNDDSSSSGSDNNFSHEGSESGENTDHESTPQRYGSTAGQSRGRRGRRGSVRRGRIGRGLERGGQRQESQRRGRRGGRRRGQGQGQRSTRQGMRHTRGVGRGYGGLVPEVNVEERQAQHEQQIQELVNGLDMDTLQRLAMELLRRQPAVFADLVNGEIPINDRQDEPDGAPLPPAPPPHQQPDWCKCGQCRVMPTQIENKCCTRTVRPCITTLPLFEQLILDANVLDIAMRYREDILVVDHPRNNENFRHSAYRQYVLWQHGRLGQGNRRVVPSCCVTAIRSRYPSPNGIYRGFQPARL